MSTRRRGTSSQAQPSTPAQAPSERSLSGPFGVVSEFLLSISHVPIFLGALTLTALVGYHVTNEAESLKEISPLPLLNFRSSYTPQAIYELFADLGPEGRAAYSKINVMSTGIFPALVAFCFSVVIGPAFQKAGLPHEWNLLPFLYLLAATLENVGIAYLLFKFPSLEPNLAALVGVVAGFKFRFLTYMALAVLLGLVWLAKGVIQRRLSRKHE